MTELSVIIPSMRPRGMIEAIPALEADASAEYEVIVREDDGAATARNRGAREASTNKLVFIDDDARPRPGYLRQMSTRLDEYDAVAGRVVDPGSGVSARMAPNYGYYQGDEPHLTDTGVGCNLGVRKDVFEQTDGFDDRIEWGGEDTLFIRSLAKNHELLYDPDAVVEHPMFESVKEFWRKQLRLGRSDVYIARAREEPVFQYWYDYVPASLDSTIRGTIIKTIGKNLRIGRRLLTLRIDDVPEPREYE